MLRYRQNEPCCYSCIYLFIHYFFCMKHTGQSILFPGKPQGLWGRLSIQLWTQLSQISSYKLEHVAEKEENAAPCSTFPGKEREREEKMLLERCLEKCWEGVYPVTPRSMLQQGKGPLAGFQTYFFMSLFHKSAKSKAEEKTWTAHTSSIPGCIQSSGMILPSKESNFSCSSEPNNELLFPLLMTQRVVLNIHYFPE